MKQTLILLFVILFAHTSRAEWQAFNDSANKNGGTDDPNVTTINIGRTSPGPTEDVLLQLESGASTGVTARYEETISTGSVFWTSDPITVDPESDAATLFGPVLDLEGNISYGDAPGWHVDLILEGLDSGRSYTFAGTAMRGGGQGYAERTTHWRLIGADAFTYASSQGAWKVGEDSVEFSTGHNEVGYVARWTGIRPGADGKIIIRTTHTVGEANGGLPGAHAYKGYAGGVFMVQLEPPPAKGWQAFNDSANKNGGTEDPNITTINVGRTSVGPTEDVLLQLESGASTGVTARYEETFSTGSVFWTSDPITVDPESDAATLFGPVLDLEGNISYGDAPGWHVDLVLEGLDSGRSYTFAGTAMRGGGQGYAERTTHWRLIGADAFTYASSQGAWKVGEDSVEFSTGHNEVGYVARWTGIRPGADGKIIIRTTHTVGEANGGLPGAHAYKGYAGGAFMLELESGGSQASQQNMQIVRLFPFQGLPANPASKVVVALDPGDGVLNTDRVEMWLDGSKVEASLLESDGLIEIMHAPDSAFESGSVHEVEVRFIDTLTPELPYQSAWSFTTVDYSDLPVLNANQTVDASDIENLRSGFGVRTVATDPFNASGANWALESAEDLFFIWDQPHENLADLDQLNEKGYFVESGGINYQRDQLAIGNHGDEKPFPGIAGTASLIFEGEDQPSINFGCEIVAILELEEGYHDFSITSSPQHELYLGLGPDAFLLEPDELINPGKTDDQGWRYRFLVPERGFYPFTLLYFDDLTGSSTLTTSGGSASSLEWAVKSPLGTTPLINAPVAGTIRAYIPSFAADKPLITAIELDSISARSFQFNTQSGSTYFIEGSTDLKSWDVIAEVKATDSATTYEDHRKIYHEAYFYRVRLP